MTSQLNRAGRGIARCPALWAIFRQGRSRVYMEKKPESPSSSGKGRGCRLHIIAILFAFSVLYTLPAEAAQSITAPSDIALNPGVADFNAGEKVSANNTIDWTSDVDWIVTVKSLNANLGPSDDLTYIKPLSDLLWKLSAGSSWTEVTTADVTVQTGPIGGGSGSFDMDFKFLLAWSLDKPGTYSTTLQFTITTQ